VLFVRPLTEKELEQLRMLLRHVQASRLKDRYQAIWFSHLGKSVQEIARLLDVSEDTVRRWIHRFEEDGFDGLADDYRSGRPPRATGRYVERLLELVHISPLRMGYPRNSSRRTWRRRQTSHSRWSAYANSSSSTTYASGGRSCGW